MEHPGIVALAKILRIEGLSPLLLEETLRIQKSSESLEENGHILFHTKDQFDSGFFALEVGKIMGILVDGSYDSRTFKRLLRRLPYDYTLLRTSQQHKRYLQSALELPQSILLDTMVELVAPSRSWRPIQEDLVIDDHRLLQEVPAFAKEFCYGRLFSEPKFTKGRELYQEWLKNSIQKKVANRVVAIRTKSFWDGFASIKDVSFGNLRGWEIPLLVKHPSSKRPKIAETILRAIQRIAAKEKVDYITIATHGENIPALRGYIAAGFSPYETSVSMRFLHQNLE